MGVGAKLGAIVPLERARLSKVFTRSGYFQSACKRGKSRKNHTSQESNQSLLLGWRLRGGHGSGIAVAATVADLMSARPGSSLNPMPG
jgi:hypothetical protein